VQQKDDKIEEIKRKQTRLEKHVDELRKEKESDEEEIVDGGNMAMLQASSNTARHSQNGRTLFVRQQEMEVVLAEVVDAVAYLGREIHEMDERNNNNDDDNNNSNNVEDNTGFDYVLQ